tara:strand:- start:16179 stop:17399 length:1221 start_codon:yes stop_codon:yes gene_type:complete
MDPSKKKMTPTEYNIKRIENNNYINLDDIFDNMNMFKANLIEYFKLAGDYIIDIPKEECDDDGNYISIFKCIKEQLGGENEKIKKYKKDDMSAYKTFCQYCKPIYKINLPSESEKFNKGGQNIYKTDTLVKGKYDSNTRGNVGIMLRLEDLTTKWRCSNKYNDDEISANPALKTDSNGYPSTISFDTDKQKEKLGIKSIHALKYIDDIYKISVYFFSTDIFTKHLKKNGQLNFNIDDDDDNISFIIKNKKVSIKDDDRKVIGEELVSLYDPKLITDENMNLLTNISNIIEYQKNKIEMPELKSSNLSIILPADSKITLLFVVMDLVTIFQNKAWSNNRIIKMDVDRSNCKDLMDDNNNKFNDAEYLLKRNGLSKEDKKEEVIDIVDANKENSGDSDSDDDDDDDED